MMDAGFGKATILVEDTECTAIGGDLEQIMPIGLLGYCFEGNYLVTVLRLKHYVIIVNIDIV